MAEIEESEAIARTRKVDDITLTSGQELRNVDLQGRIIVRGSDVTIHNCRIRGARKGTASFPLLPTQYRPLIDARHASVKNLKVTSCHLEPDDASPYWESGISGVDFSLYDSVVTRTVDAVRINSGSSGKRTANVEIDSCVMGFLGYFRAVAPGIVHPSDIESHCDVIHIEGTSGAVIRNNELYGYWSTNWGDEGIWKPSRTSSDFQVIQFNNRKDDPVSNVIITGNTLYGGRIPINMGGALRVNSSHHIATIHRNVFAGDPGLNGVTILADRTWASSTGLDCGEGTANANHLYSALGPEIVVKRNG